MELPTIQTDGIASGSGAEFMGSPVYRRTHKKQGSTVYVAPRDEVAAPTKVPLNRVAQGVGMLAGAQALGKLVSFVLNQMLLRVVNSTDLGQSSQMELFAATALSLTRDAVRFAAVRETLSTKADERYHTGTGPVHDTKAGAMQETVNIGYIPIALGLPLVGILFTFAWRSTIDPLMRATSSLWAASILIELASEPCFLLHQLKMNMALRARVESAAAILRGIVTLGLVMMGHSPMLAFALGQLAHSLGLFASYIVASLSEWHYAGFKLYMQPVRDDEANLNIWFNPKIFTLAKGMYFQSVFKYILTESDRILVSFLLSFEKQGEYALAANYGSLLARLLLFPVEEALRSLFARSLKSNKSKEKEEREPNPSEQMVARQRSLSTRSRSSSVRSRSASVNSSVLVSPVVVAQGVPGSPNIGAQSFGENTKVSDTETAVTALTTVLRLYTYLGVGAISVGPYLARFGLQILLSNAWASSNAPQVLAVYVCYIPILAWNGSLEAFVQSVASIDDLKRQSKVMLVLAVTFIVAAYVFMNLLSFGAVGLVYAQMLNMVLRTGWSFNYVTTYFRSYSINEWWARLVPSKLVSAVSLIIFLTSHAIGPIEATSQLVLHILLGAALVAAFAFSERSHLLHLWKNRK